jgi:hypothetical protein
VVSAATGLLLYRRYRRHNRLSRHSRRTGVRICGAEEQHSALYAGTADSI